MACTSLVIFTTYRYRYNYLKCTSTTRRWQIIQKKHGGGCLVLVSQMLFGSPCDLPNSLGRGCGDELCLIQKSGNLARIPSNRTFHWDQRTLVITSKRDYYIGTNDFIMHLNSYGTRYFNASFHINKFNFTPWLFANKLNIWLVSVIQSEQEVHLGPRNLAKLKPPKVVYPLKTGLEDSIHSNKPIKLEKHWSLYEGN